VLSVIVVAEYSLAAKLLQIRVQIAPAFAGRVEVVQLDLPFAHVVLYVSDAFYEADGLVVGVYKPAEVPELGVVALLSLVGEPRGTRRASGSRHYDARQPAVSIRRVSACDERDEAGQVYGFQQEGLRAIDQAESPLTKQDEATDLSCHASYEWYTPVAIMEHGKGTRKPDSFAAAALLVLTRQCILLADCG
jgi:hypothetical protein